MADDPKRSAAIARGKAGKAKWGDEAYLVPDLYRLADELSGKIRACELRLLQLENK